MKRMEANAFLIAAVALALGSGCGSDESAPIVALTSVSLAPVQAVDLDDRIEAAGELVAKERAAIAAEVGGRVTEVLIEEGVWVETDDALLTIDPERRKLELDSARAALEEARAEKREARRELDRAKLLREKTVASLTMFEQAETELQLAGSRVLGSEARVGVAQRALDDATVKAPFAGIIDRRTVSRGEFVNAGQKLFELVSLDPIEVEFHVAERDSSRVRLGQVVEVRVAPYPDRTFRAIVSTVSPTIDPRTRTLRVKGLMANSDDALRPGLFARVDLGISTRLGIAVVPEDAVLQRADGAVVFRFGADDRVERRVIEVGVIRDGIVEVLSGVSPGDVVVLRGHSRLVDGDLVAPRDTNGNRREIADAREPGP